RRRRRHRRGGAGGPTSDFATPSVEEEDGRRDGAARADLEIRGGAVEHEAGGGAGDVGDERERGSGGVVERGEGLLGVRAPPRGGGPGVQAPAVVKVLVRIGRWVGRVRRESGDVEGGLRVRRCGRGEGEDGETGRDECGNRARNPAGSKGWAHSSAPCLRGIPRPALEGIPTTDGAVAKPGAPPLITEPGGVLTNPPSG